MLWGRIDCSNVAIEGWQVNHPQLAAQAMKHLAEGLAVFDLPDAYKARMRTALRKITRLKTGRHGGVLMVFLVVFGRLCQDKGTHPAHQMMHSSKIEIKERCFLKR